jgi:hypothetical protein
MSYRKPKRPLSPAQKQALSQLTRMQEAILGEMVESGSEPLIFVANRLLRKFPEVPPEALLSDIADALEGLRAAGVVAFVRPNRRANEGQAGSAPEEMTDIVFPTDLLMWDAVGGYWRWGEGRPGTDKIHLDMPIQVLDAFRLVYAPWRARNLA